VTVKDFIIKHPYELITLIWILACFFSLLKKVPKKMRRQTVREIAAVTAIFVSITAIVVVALDDGPKAIDLLSESAGKVIEELGG
jgi:hypothetical protein